MDRQTLRPRCRDNGGVEQCVDLGLQLADLIGSAARDGMGAAADCVAMRTVPEAPHALLEVRVRGRVFSCAWSETVGHLRVVVGGTRTKVTGSTPVFHEIPVKPDGASGSQGYRYEPATVGRAVPRAARHVVKFVNRELATFQRKRQAVEDSRMAGDLDRELRLALESAPHADMLPDLVMKLVWSQHSATGFLVTTSDHEQRDASLARERGRWNWGYTWDPRRTSDPGVVNRMFTEPGAMLGSGSMGGMTEWDAPQPDGLEPLVPRDVTEKAEALHARAAVRLRNDQFRLAGPMGRVSCSRGVNVTWFGDVLTGWKATAVTWTGPAAQFRKGG